MIFKGGTPLKTLSGENYLIGEETVTMGKVLSTVIYNMTNDANRTELSNKECFMLALKLFSSKDVTLSKAEHALCCEAAPLLPIKYAYPIACELQTEKAE